MENVCVHHGQITRECVLSFLLYLQLTPKISVIKYFETYVYMNGPKHLINGPKCKI